jgi:hypothetical protein
VFTLFLITIAAAEIGLGLAIVLLVFRNRESAQLDELRDLLERDDEEAVTRDAVYVAVLAPSSPPRRSSSWARGGLAHRCRFR